MSAALGKAPLENHPAQHTLAFKIFGPYVKIIRNALLTDFIFGKSPPRTDGNEVAHPHYLEARIVEIDNAIAAVDLPDVRRKLEIVRDAHFAFEKVVRQELGGKEMTVKEKAEAVKVLPEFFKVNGEYFF